MPRLSLRHIRLLAISIGLVAALTPAVVLADDPTATQQAGVAADTVWVIVAACLVMFMQAGFAMLEVGFSRMKNVGTVVAKVVTNLSVSSIAYWAVGFGIAFGAGGIFAVIGTSGFFPTFSPGSQLNLPAIAGSTAPAAAKWFFEFVFCAVSLAIVWGTMIERTKFIVYILFGIPFAAIIYPLISHQLFGGGFLMATLGSQDFAGSTVVHLTGATAGFAGLLLLGPRIGIRPVLTAGLALSAGGLVLYAQLPVQGHYFWDLFPAFLLSGIGLALAFVPMSIGALTGVQQSDAGVASGLINTSQQIGGAIGVAAATTIATTFSAHYVNAHAGASALGGAALTHGFQVAFYVLAAIAAAGAVLAAVLTESRAVTVQTEAAEAELVLEAA